jgi:hypothetical protein
MKVLAVLIILVGTVCAEEQCPLQITRVMPDYVGFASIPPCRHIRQCDAVEVINKTDKKIVGSKFKMIYLDAVGDPVDTGVDYTSEGKIKVGKKEVFVWNTKFLINDKSQGAIAWVEKVLYEDGTTWEDTGSRKCLLDSKIHQ